jgi:signal transduction histidine kinase
MQLNSRQWLIGTVAMLAAAVVLLAPRRFEVPPILPVEPFQFWLVVWLTLGAGGVICAVALAAIRPRAHLTAGAPGAADPRRQPGEGAASGTAACAAPAGGPTGRRPELERVLRGLQAAPGAPEPADATLCANAARLRRQNEGLLALARGRFQAADSLPAALWPLTEAACETLETERASIWRLSADRGVIECVDLYERAGASHTHGPRLAVADYPSYFSALAHARTIAAHDAASDPRTREFGAGYLEPLGIASVLVAPVRRCGTVVGVVCLEQVGLARRWASDEEGFAGAIADFVSLILEADERRQADEALRQEGERLRQGQKIEAIGQLAAGVAHDFNALLSVINDCSEILALGLSPHHPHRPLIEEIAQAGNRAGLLTQQLLAFSRRQILAPCRLDLNVVLDDTGKLLRRLIGDEVELVTRLRLGLGQVEVDPGQLQQVILHLAVNARDAMPRGGTLTLETASVEVSPDAVDAPGGAAPGSYVALSVRDTGRGMDEATRGRIFEPFFTTKEAGAGTGLGLATVHGIVTQSGGYVTCKSAPGLGTVFTILLPRALDQPAWPADQPVVAMAMARGEETILLVEEEAPVRTLARAVLEEFGYTVLAARDAEEALRLCARHDGPIQLLLTDVVTAGQSGREVAAAVRAIRSDLRVLYISGYTDDIILRDGITAVDSALLLKPFVPATLLAKVRAVLDGAARATAG